MCPRGIILQIFQSKMNMHEYRRKTLNRDVNWNAHLGFMLALSTR